MKIRLSKNDIKILKSALDVSNFEYQTSEEDKERLIKKLSGGDKLKQTEITEQMKAGNMMQDAINSFPGILAGEDQQEMWLFDKAIPSIKAWERTSA